MKKIIVLALFFASFSAFAQNGGVASVVSDFVSKNINLYQNTPDGGIIINTMEQDAAIIQKAFKAYTEANPQLDVTKCKIEPAETGVSDKPFSNVRSQLGAWLRTEAARIRSLSAPASGKFAYGLYSVTTVPELTPKNNSKSEDALGWEGFKNTFEKLNEEVRRDGYYISRLSINPSIMNDLKNNYGVSENDVREFLKGLSIDVRNFSVLQQDDPKAPFRMSTLMDEERKVKSEIRYQFAQISCEKKQLKITIVVDRQTNIVDSLPKTTPKR